MTYFDRQASDYCNRLHPWCIIRLLPNVQRTVVARFRKCSEIEAHCSALQRLNPDADYAIVFDPPEPQPDQLKLEDVPLLPQSSLHLPFL